MTDSEKLDLILDELLSLKQGQTNIKLHLENTTDKNISLLAENHSNLIDKLNQTIKVADKDLLYEIKINILSEKVARLEKEITDLKNKIA